MSLIDKLFLFQMYEDALSENEKLKSRLDDSKLELSKIRSQLDRVTQVRDGLGRCGVKERLSVVLISLTIICQEAQAVLKTTAHACLLHPLGLLRVWLSMIASVKNYDP